MERGAPTPEWLEDEPCQEDWDAFYMQAFWDLSTERQLGFTVGPIPTSSIYRYPGANGFSPAMMALFVRVIQVMDSTYREWAESERKKAQKKNNRDASKSHIGETKTRQDKT